MQHLPLPTIHAKILAYGCTTIRGIESRRNPVGRQRWPLPEPKRGRASLAAALHVALGDRATRQA